MDLRNLLILDAIYIGGRDAESSTKWADDFVLAGQKRNAGVLEDVRTSLAQLKLLAL